MILIHPLHLFLHIPDPHSFFFLSESFRIRQLPSTVHPTLILRNCPSFLKNEAEAIRDAGINISIANRVRQRSRRPQAPLSIPQGVNDLTSPRISHSLSFIHTFIHHIYPYFSLSLYLSIYLCFSYSPPPPPQLSSTTLHQTLHSHPPSPLLSNPHLSSSSTSSSTISTSSNDYGFLSFFLLSVFFIIVVSLFLNCSLSSSHFFFLFLFFLFFFPVPSKRSISLLKATSSCRLWTWPRKSWRKTLVRCPSLV